MATLRVLTLLPPSFLTFFFQELGHFIHIYKSTGPSEGTLKAKGKFYSRTHIQIISTYSVLKRERNTTRSLL